MDKETIKDILIDSFLMAMFYFGLYFYIVSNNLIVQAISLILSINGLGLIVTRICDERCKGGEEVV